MKVNIDAKKINQLINAENVFINTGKKDEDKDKKFFSDKNESHHLHDIIDKQKIINVKQKLGENRIQEVISILLELNLSEDRKNMLFQIKQRYRVVSDQNMKFLISEEKHRLELSKICNSLLNFIDKLF